MKVINDLGYPAAYMRAAEACQYRPQDGVYRVTSLIGPPLIRHLLMKHWETLTTNASELQQSILGQAWHAFMDSHSAPEDGVTEIRLNAEVDGEKITGQLDHLGPDEIEDWKNTKIWSYLSDKKEWAYQQNIYRWLLFNQTDKLVSKLAIRATYVDWSKNKCLGEDSLPQSRFLHINVPVWPIETVPQFIKDRLAAHKALAPCTSDEMWERPGCHAVMKKGRKSALKLYTKKEDAEKRASDEGSACSVVERVGVRVRCQDYCPVRSVCEQNIYK